MGIRVVKKDPVRTVVGIDPSTSTGFVVLKLNRVNYHWMTVCDKEIAVPSLPKTATMVERMIRVLNLSSMVAAAVTDWAPMAIAIEGYGYANSNSLVTLVELGGGIRTRLVDHYHGPRAAAFAPPVHLIEVAPASLKKFVLGKGVGPKELIMQQVLKRWGYEARTNNIADAFVLAQIAAAHVGPYPGLTKPQQEVMATLSKKA